MFPRFMMFSVHHNARTCNLGQNGKANERSFFRSCLLRSAASWARSDLLLKYLCPKNVVLTDLYAVEWYTYIIYTYNWAFVYISDCETPHETLFWVWPVQVLPKLLAGRKFCFRTGPDMLNQRSKLSQDSQNNSSPPTNSIKKQSYKSIKDPARKFKNWRTNPKTPTNGKGRNTASAQSQPGLTCSVEIILLPGVCPILLASPVRLWLWLSSHDLHVLIRWA